MSSVFTRKILRKKKKEIWRQTYTGVWGQNQKKVYPQFTILTMKRFVQYVLTLLLLCKTTGSQ